MDKLKHSLVFSALAAVLSGCAWVPQTATLNPTPRITPSSVGNGVDVAVRVLDRRPSQTLGHRGLESKNAAIKTEQNVAALFQERIIEGLTRKGFSAVPHEGQPGRLLTVEIRQIDYTAEMEFWKGVAKTEVTLNVSVIKDGVRFERNYSGKRSEKTIEAPSAKTNERLINNAITDALQRLFEDQSLMRYLAE
jgi:uncharacterized lipoprotein YajG